MRPINRSGAAAVVLSSTIALSLAGCADSSTALSGRQRAVQDSNTNVSFHKCAAACTGSIDGAKYAIALPDKWNGTLLLYSHGYRFAQPGPPDFSPVRTTAQLTSTDPNGTGSDPLSKKLLADGYALAGSAYRSNGWAVADGVAADEALHARFVKLVGQPKRTYVWGDSLGGLITELVAEKHPEWVDGAAPMCGAVSGPTMNLDLALDVAFAVKTLIDPSLKLTGYSSAQDANTNWTHAADALKTAAADTAHGGTAKVLFIAALVGASNRTQTYDGADIVSQVKGTVESLLTALAYGTAGRYEIEQRVGGNPSDNSKADYWARISSDTALLLAELGGDPGGYAKQLAAAPRVTADAAARQKFIGLGDPSGRIVVPTVTMHTEADPLVLVQNEGVLAQRARVAGRSGELSQLFIAPPAKYSETTGAPYGAGHCNFNDRQRLALVQTLDSWVRHDTYPVQAGLVGRFGAGYDPNFAPGPWPTTPAV